LTCFVILASCSFVDCTAGLAVFLGINEIQNDLKTLQLRNSNSKRSIRLVGMPDSGFFPNYDSVYVSKGMKELTLRPGGPRYQHLNGKWYPDEFDPQTQRNIYGSLMKKVFNFTGIGKPLEELELSDPLSPVSQCQSLLSDPRECIFPQNLLSHISVPLFILQVLTSPDQSSRLSSSHLLSSLPLAAL
jgi:hypothetical protein